MLQKMIVSSFLTVALVAMAGFGSVVHASVIAYDGFETYTATADLNGGNAGTGFTGPWAAVADHATVQPKTMDDPNGNVDGGNQALRFQPTTNLSDVSSFIQRTIPGTSDTLYMSLLVRKEVMASDDFVNFQVSDGATGNTTAALGVGLRNNTGNPFFARVGSSNSGQTTNAAATNANEDYFIVAKFSKDGSSTFNRTDLFINPTSLTEPTTANATAISGVTGLTSLSLFSVRHFQPEAGDTLFIDELRFATTFEDAVTVVPEPASLASGLVGLVLIAARRRRR